MGFAVVACSPAPRDVSWFEANPDAAREVIKRCAAGDRETECINARAAINRIKADTRMERYRKGFE